jgi:hypothetical protein
MIDHQTHCAPWLTRYEIVTGESNDGVSRIANLVILWSDDPHEHGKVDADVVIALTGTDCGCSMMHGNPGQRI